MLYTSTSAHSKVQKLQVAIGKTVCLMTCFRRSPRGRTKSAGASGVLEPRVLSADADEGGVGRRR